MTPETLLAEAFHAVCEKEWDRQAGIDPSWQGTMHARDAHDQGVAEVLAASPTLARALSLGAAWLAAEAALPESGHLSAGYHHGESRPPEVRVWYANGHRADCADEVSATGDTPETALSALAAAVREVQS